MATKVTQHATAWTAWQVALVVASFFLIAAAAALEVITAHFHTVSTVTTDVTNATTTTIASPGPPPAAFITTSLGLGIACLLLAALWNRISKISVAGVDIELDPAASAKLASKSKARTSQDPSKFDVIFASAARALADGTVTATSTQALTGELNLAQVEDLTLDRAVDYAAAQAGLE